MREQSSQVPHVCARCILCTNIRINLKENILESECARLYRRVIASRSEVSHRVSRSIADCGQTRRLPHYICMIVLAAYMEHVKVRRWIHIVSLVSTAQKVTRLSETKLVHWCATHTFVAVWNPFAWARYSRYHWSEPWQCSSAEIPHWLKESRWFIPIERKPFVLVKGRH